MFFSRPFKDGMDANSEDSGFINYKRFTVLGTFGGVFHAPN